MVAVLAVVPATLPTLTARATVAQAYPGGCTVAYAAVAPPSCNYISIGGEPEQVAFAGTGTVSVSGCNGGGLASSPPGVYLTGPQTASCTYTVAISGSGIAVAVDQNAGAFGECFDFSDGVFDNDVADCFYDAISGKGDAIGQAISNLPAEIVVSVKNLSSGGGVVASCTVTGTGVLTLNCPYTETLGDEYEVTASDPTFNDLELALVANG